MNKINMPFDDFTRWGGRETIQLAAGATVSLRQFADLKLLAPQQIIIVLYAVAPAPIEPMNIVWSIGIGIGSTNHVEKFTQVVVDDRAQAPLVLFRPASAIQVTGVLTSTGAASHQVDVVAMLAPTSPVWTSPGVCRIER